MHGADAAAFQPAFHAEIEVGRVDSDEDIGPPRLQMPAQTPAQAQQTRQMAQDFGQAHHRQFAAVVPCVQALGAHRRAAYARELRLGKTRPQFRDQPGAELVAGNFACDKRDALGAGNREWGVGNGQKRRLTRSGSRSDSMPLRFPILHFLFPISVFTATTAVRRVR